MQENIKFIKLQKACAIALLCLFFAVFVGSIFCATILPFAYVTGVASADWIPSGEANTRYVFNSLSQDFVGDVGLWYNLGVNMSSDSTYYDSFNNSILWRGDSTVYSNSDNNFGYRVSILGYLYGYYVDYKTSAYYFSSYSAPYKCVFPLAIVERFNLSDDSVLFRNLGLVSYQSSDGNLPFLFASFITTRYKDSLGNNADMRIAANYSIRHAGSYNLPVDSYSNIGGFCKFPFVVSQVGTGKTANYYFSFQGFVHDITKVDSSYESYWGGDLPVGLTQDSLLQVQTLLSQVMSFGYTAQVIDTNESAYQSGYVNGVQDQKDREDKLLNDKYNEGYSAGKVNGYQIGYDEGKVSSSYSFSSLLGAVFDAPIEAFKGLFNFEILGTNMQGFVLALLTLSVIIVVIKIALGGK